MAHLHHHDGRPKNGEELLGDLIWQGAVQVYFLKLIKEGIENMATPEQIAALTTAVDELVAGESAEEAQIQAVIDALKAGNNTADPAIDAAVATIQSLKERIANIVPDAPPA